MEKDSESWLHQRQSDGQFHNTKSSELQFNSVMQITDIPCAIPCTQSLPSNYALPAFGFSGVQNFRLGQLKEPHGCFSRLPCFRQVPKSDTSIHEKILQNVNPHSEALPAVTESCSKARTLIAGGGQTAKQFLVFDQTGNKTTVMFGSGIGTPIQQLVSWNPKPSGCCNESGDEGIGSNEDDRLGPKMTDDLNEDLGTSEESEMHEDTDEINALLYSDDDDSYSENSEDTSTGHSPSTMTAYEKQGWGREDIDAVASSDGPVKRQRLSDSSYNVPCITKTSSSVKPNGSLEYEDDAESSCVGGTPITCSAWGSLSGNKRLRKEKICQTVNILQTIIPSGKGKDAVTVLDEAINYLRTLKFKAESLGLSAM